MSSKSSGYGVLLWLLVPIGIYFTAWFVQKRNYEAIERDLATAVGTITYKGADAYHLQYSVDGKIFELGGKEPYEYLQEGESYIVEYERSDPDNASIAFSKPVFDDQIRYHDTVCKSLDQLFAIITFTYSVDGRSFTRNCFYDDEQSLDARDYLVRYRENNPEIGYLIEKDETRSRGVK